MTEFAELNARLDVALELIGVRASGPDPVELEKLNAHVIELEAELSLASEALADSQLELEQSRHEGLGQTQMSEEQRIAMLGQIHTLDKARVDGEVQLAKSWQYNKHLKELNSNLRIRNEENVGDAGLINASLEAELEQIKAQRILDLEQVNSILARMTPLVESNQDG